MKSIKNRATVRTAAAAAAVALLAANVPDAGAAIIWQVPTGSSSWSTPANWVATAGETPPPNAVGANATFNNAATANNPAQTGNRTVTLDGAKTVGSIVFNADGANAFTNSVTTGTGGPLTFDEAGNGPATILTQGTGTGNNTISVAMVLVDQLVATVNQQNTASAAGSLNVTAAISGAGGIMKLGDGLMTLGTGAKTYTGATILSGGRTRTSEAAHPTATSSFTINDGAQLTLITNNGNFTFGSGQLNLNGDGTSSGQFSPFPGAIRNDTNIAVTINNAVTLESDTTLHVEGAATGSITFPNVVGGPGRLRLTAPSSSVNQGQLVLQGANTYFGGTLVAGGNLVARGANATFGTGGVLVSDADSPDSIARITIETGVLNAIADDHSLSLVGGGAPGVADENFANLGVGVDETVGLLFLGGVQQTAPGTYGSVASGANFQFDDYFAGTGVVRLVPEPGTLGLLALGGLGLLARRRRR